MTIPTVAPLTEQDIREHKMLARIERLEAEIAMVIEALRDGTDYDDPLAEYERRVH